MKNRTTLLTASTLSCVLALGTVMPAHADSPTSEVLDVLASVTESATNDPTDTSDVLVGVADVPTASGGDSAINSRVGATDVVVPIDPSDSLVLELEHVGISIDVRLPFADEAADAIVETNGVVSYDNGNGSTTVPVVKEDGSVQITTIIDNVEAPTRFDYDFALPPGGYLEDVGDGLIIIRDDGGEFQGGILPAWAKDADGAEVPTHFEIDGGVLTQVVHHGPNSAYPVVADPAVGGGLLAGYWKNRPGGVNTGGGVQWSTHLSAWGAVVYTRGLAGIEIVKNQGWSEWRRFPTTPTTDTIEQQYKCHAQFGYAVWLSGFWWDFETGRSPNHNWFWNPQGCNWK